MVSSGHGPPNEVDGFLREMAALLTSSRAEPAMELYLHEHGRHLWYRHVDFLGMLDVLV
jgi:hypothetical protein